MDIDMLIVLKELFFVMLSFFQVCFYGKMYNDVQDDFIVGVQGSFFYLVLRFCFQ